MIVAATLPLAHAPPAGERRRTAAGVGFGLTAVGKWGAYLACARLGTTEGLGPAVERGGMRANLRPPGLIRRPDRHRVANFGDPVPAIGIVFDGAGLATF